MYDVRGKQVNLTKDLEVDGKPAGKAYTRASIYAQTNNP